MSTLSLSVSLNHFLKLSNKCIKRTKALKTCRETLEESQKCQFSGESLIEITRPKKLALIRHSHDRAKMIMILLSKEAGIEANTRFACCRYDNHPPV